MQVTIIIIIRGTQCQDLTDRSPLAFCINISIALPVCFRILQADSGYVDIGTIKLKFVYGTGFVRNRVK